ncbi:MAG: flagellar motor switch phosphatase FliY [Firmicutes bacterium]|nr:flagellar motor switch phosphatase FliY [[Eubacterium] siraeum]MCM1486940.1 flagellar motor switch phosphatase FliY [Bacillota bacterium]
MANVEFSDLQKDAIGEILNISMGSAATAVSELLSAKVWITTPRVEVKTAKEMEYHKLEPAVCIKIQYVKGLSGANMMVWKQDDVQLILNQLMGQPLVVSPDFEFDELNISAVSEVMNQMMGASATALSNFLGFTVDISTPQPIIMDEVSSNLDVTEFEPEDTIVSVTFDLTIDGVIKSEFASVMGADFAKSIADKMLGTDSDDIGGAEEPAPAPAPAAAAPEPAPAPAPAPVAQPAPMPMPQMPAPDPQAAYAYPPQGAYPYPYPPAPQPQYQYPAPTPINIQNAQFQNFGEPSVPLSNEQRDNLNLLMDVPLQISVEIGSARRKVKDILEFSQGSIIELERQAGAPVDIVVNGNLIAKGDVVVIDDNFAVRITEIIKSKLIDTLSKD